MIIRIGGEAEVAGSSLMLKENQILFKEGDAADGMYLIRKGELCVFLDKNGNEVRLATIGTGGMIGEMAFFDKKPRSASVKATSETEVTKITADDFSKLMKQIPKWFVSIMSSLSTRLRETNDRLQKLENKAAGAKSPFEDMIKILHVLILIWHKEGVKEGKNLCLNRVTAEKQIQEIFGVQEAWIKNMLDTLVKFKFFQITQDSYKNSLLSTSNRASLSIFANFVREFVKDNPGHKSLPQEGIELLDALNNLAKVAPYDSSVISMDDLIAEGDKNSFITANWKTTLSFFKKGSEALSLTKVGASIGFKANKEELPKLIDMHKLLAGLASAGLA